MQKEEVCFDGNNNVGEGNRRETRGGAFFSLFFLFVSFDMEILSLKCFCVGSALESLNRKKCFRSGLSGVKGCDQVRTRE